MLASKMSIELVIAYSNFDENYVLSMPIWTFMNYYDRAVKAANKDKKNNQG